jgi:hypothetical protein
MSNQQKDVDDDKETNPGTLLLITLAALLIPLMFVGFFSH